MALPAWLFAPEELKRIRAQSVEDFKILLAKELQEEASCIFCDAFRDLALGGEAMLPPVCLKHQQKRHDLLD